jgi:membrane protein insertase Oxa1/YidC/SpoIIIJ
VVEILDSVFLQPLMLIYSAVFDFLPASVGTGARVIFFSLVLNLTLLPVYRQMEAAFRNSRDLRRRVREDVARMKRHFKGRERYFYIRAVYRQYNYHPVSELLRSADLVVQIVVFATVYRYLSGLDALTEAAFGPIRDLSAPDGLLGGINVLPILMTAVNVVAVCTYAPEAGRRVQGLLLAALFLVLLYGSASGLVLYWTMNNVFSVVRNAVEHRLLPRISPTLQAGLGRQFARISTQR